MACADAGLQLHEHATGDDDEGDEDEAAEEKRWSPLPQLRLGDVAVLVGATLAVATGNALRAATHRVLPQPTARLAAVMRLRGVPQALLPRATVGAFEALFAASRVSVNRDHAAWSAADERGGARGRGGDKRRRVPVFPMSMPHDLVCD